LKGPELDLTDEIKNKLLLGTDIDGKTTWQRAADWGNSEILQEVWEWAKEKIIGRDK